MQTAYIIDGYRTAVGKSSKGALRYTRPDTMSAEVLQYLMKKNPKLPIERIDDLIVGNAMPEAQQGLNIARFIALMGLNTDKVSAVTINRYCASGSEAIAMATAKIQSGMADCIIAGGCESMSYVPMGGYKPAPDYETSKDHADYYWGMGLTAEAVAKKYSISREAQDEFSYQSHQKAISALQRGVFKDEVVPINVDYTYVEGSKIKTKKSIFDQEEGPRADTSIEKLAKLKPVFALDGSVTAGNSSQTSDGAAFVLVVSENVMKEFNLTPIARVMAHATAGVDPRLMGIGPVYAIPKALQRAGLSLSQIDAIELNEAFASQSLAVIAELGIDKSKVNVNGGAIALGHPLGCTGAKLTVQILNEMKRRNQKYGMVTMCVGVGQGAATIYERL